MEITAAEFKTQFPRFSPAYLPVYTEGTYYKGDIRYYNGAFYEVKVTSTTNPPTDTTDWKQVEGNVLNYTQDSDILNAANEAKVNFNEGLFADTSIAKLVFLYLTAFYLTLDFQTAMAPMGATGLVQSKSVGSVSESYAIPQAFMDKPMYAFYMHNAYGRKYLSLITPYLTGNIILSRGGITID